MADQPITTSIDDLVKYLHEHGETDSTSLAGALKVSERIIETWADVLEKAKIVKINYRIGKMYISEMVATSEGAEVAKKAIELKKGAAEMDLATQMAMINQINITLDEFKKYVAGAELAFGSKAGPIKEKLDALDKLGAQVDGSYKKLKEKKDYMDQLATTLETEMKGLEDKANIVERTSSDDAESTKVIAELKASLADAENRVKTLNESFNSTVDSNRKSFEALVNQIKDETKSLRELLGRREKELQEYTAFIGSYKRDADAIKRKAAGERTKLLDDIAKSREETQKVYAAAEAQMLNITNTLKDVKNQFGGYADFNDKLNGIKNNIDSISRQKEEIQKELEELGLQLRALSALDANKLAQRSMEMKKINDKVAKAGKKTNMLGRDTDNVKQHIDDLTK